MNIIKRIPTRTLSVFLERHNRNFVPILFTRKISTSPTRLGLTEFFDEEKNWGATEVKSGRSWKLEELRLKSNTDLHKLWYILLKEKNMLLTMEEECKRETRLFPSPERLARIEDSMENLEAVVKERNVAYHMLETGKSGVKETKQVKNVFGLEVPHTEEEHLIPKEQNTEWLNEHKYNPGDPDVKKFLTLYREKEAKKRQQERMRNLNHVIGLMKRFPNMDMDAVREQYPDVDLEKARKSRKNRGHFVPKMYNK